MSWPLASFLILAVALAGGFAWYERSRPSSRTVAIVASLAALATLGRIAFAPLPSVKPTTDIVLIAGFVLGGPPGFAVGAVAAIASNIVFGQGPWTPWQMLAWGLVGVVGGLMGIRGRRPRRWELVVVGAALSVGFDWFVTVWMYLSYTPHTWPALVALYGQGLPFDVSHLSATAILAALFGPRAVAIIARFRARTSVTFLPGGTLAPP